MIEKGKNAAISFSQRMQHPKVNYPAEFILGIHKGNLRRQCAYFG